MRTWLQPLLDPGAPICHLLFPAPHRNDGRWHNAQIWKALTQQILPFSGNSGLAPLWPLHGPPWRASRSFWNVSAVRVCCMHSVVSLSLQYWSLLCPRWGLPLAWALSALPLTPLLLGAVLQLAWIRRGVPFTMVRDCYETLSWTLNDNFLFQHLKRLVKPTDRYYRWLDLSNRAYWKSLHKSNLPRNEHLESGGSGTNAHNTSTRAWFEMERYFWPMNNE